MNSVKENWDYSDPGIKYVDSYKWKDDTLSEMELNDFLSGIKDVLDEMCWNNELVSLKIMPAREEGSYVIVPVFDDVDIMDIGLVPASELLGPNFKHDYNLDNANALSKEEYEHFLDVLKEEIAAVNKSLEQEMPSFGFRKVENAVKIRPLVEGRVSLDPFNYKQVDLDYDDLRYEGDYGPRDWETGEGTRYVDREISYTYKADYNEVAEFLVDLDDLYNTSKEFAAAVDADDYDGYYGYIDAHFEELVDKYYDDILEHFRDAAEKEAWENVSVEDVLGYDEYGEW